MRHHHSPKARLAHGWLRWLLVLPLLVVTGCSQSFWRKQADYDVYKALAQKNAHPLWDVPRLDVTADPRSRFHDPYDPDHPPLPPGDPAAFAIMDRPGGLMGYQSWHKFGSTMSVENPHWLDPFDLVATENGTEAEPETLERGIENLTLDQAIELALIHSRDYQTEIEDVYLAALALTFERFQFQVRYLGIGGGEPSSSLTYETIPGGENSLELGQRFGVSQLLPTGGQWAVELANNTLWLFTGSNESSTASALSFSIVQPLLFGAGRKVVLESLTQTEREVLYAIRNLARFRRVFFVDIVGGAGGGYLGLMEQLQQVRNQRNNIFELEQQLERLRAESAPVSPFTRQRLDEPLDDLVIPDDLQDVLSYDEERQLLIFQGPMTSELAEQLRGISDDPEFQSAIAEIVARSSAVAITLDVAQLETRLANSRTSLRQSERALADALDRYKFQLGLPPDLNVTLDDSVLQQFQLIDPRTIANQQRILDLVDNWAAIDPAASSSDEIAQVISELQEAARRVRAEVLDVVSEDFTQVQNNVSKRLEQLDTAEQREAIITGLERDQRLLSGLAGELSDLQQEIEELKPPAEVGQRDVEQAVLLVADLAELREELLRVVRGFQVVQIDLRVELLELQPFDISLEEATETALANRLDLMNARARVMDARRAVEVIANELKSQLDLVADADIRNPVGGDAFDFRGSRSSYRFGLRFTAPLDQINERNNYRAALLNYQRARREYMAFEDNVKIGIRQSWRQLDVLRDNFEIARQAVRFAATQLDQAVEESTAPVQPGARQSGGSQGLNLLNALNSVLGAQNDLIGIWTDYERNRLNIYRDMDIMEIDDRGVWNDPYYQQSRQDSPQTSNRPAANDQALAPRIILPTSQRASDPETHREFHQIGAQLPADSGTATAVPRRLTPEQQEDVDSPAAPVPDDGAGAGDAGWHRRELSVPAAVPGERSAGGVGRPVAPGHRPRQAWTAAGGGARQWQPR